jgi:hypothetical protein
MKRICIRGNERDQLPGLLVEYRLPGDRPNLGERILVQQRV